MIYQLKDGVTLNGVHPFLAYGPAAWSISAVSLVVLGRRPIVTGAREDRLRADGTDDRATWHDNGLALDLRANDVELATRERYANALRVALAPFGAFDVIGPYPEPGAHVHVELDASKLARFGFLLVVVLAVVLVR